MKFNLQAYLEDMRKEQREDHQALSVKVDDVLKIVHKHETRLVVVENTRRFLTWLGAAIGVGAITMLFDAAINHFKR